jgi:lysophospholipase L1-like esterase
MTAKDDRLFYLDVDKPMIGKDGKPRPELFIEDGLHMTDAGNQLWADLLRPLL